VAGTEAFMQPASIMLSPNQLPPWQPGIVYAGKTLKWIPPDTEENFKQLMQDPVHNEYFKQQGWTQSDSITYRINQHGFRSNEFETNHEPCMIALGCSYTMGIGLPVECIWPILVGKQLNLKVYNLAWGGISADTCFRLAQYWIPVLKPKLVAMLTPPRTRIELLMDTGCNPPAEVFMPQNKSCHFNEYDMFLKHWWLNDTNGNLNSEKNTLAIKQLTLNHGAKFVSLTADEEMGKSREEAGYARDYMHAGLVGHVLVANKMQKEL
jgi:hypothetical protein